MIDFFFIIVSTLFIFSIFRNTLFWLNLWQIKEYRLDRLLIHLLQTVQGKRLLIGPAVVVRYVIFSLYALVLIDPSLSFVYSLLVGTFFFVSFIQFGKDLEHGRFKYPVITFKVIVIGIFTMGFTSFLQFFHALDKYFWLLALDSIVPFLIAALMGFFFLPAEFYKDYLILRASKKRNRFKKLKVIGITGSYGKGSTKEFTSTILAMQFNISKTQGTINTPIGIAKSIMSHLSEKKNFFIAEMGAYKRGEIYEMCSMVKPEIGILTSINDQHLSLFGSIENTKLAKYELIESLPKNGLAIFNGNNKNSFELYKTSKKKKVLYYSAYKNDEESYELSSMADIAGVNIRVHRFSLSFDVINKHKWDKPLSLSVNLLGAHNVENLLPGIYIASHFGMTREKIKKGVSRIIPLKKTMEPFITSNGTVVIDDTFNSNPSAIHAVLSYLAIYKKRKVMVLQPMIELGQNTSKDHEKVSFEIAKVSDVLILTNRNYFLSIEKGVKSASSNCQLFIMNPYEIAQWVRRELGRDDVVVLEGKEAAFPFKFLDYEKIN